jgi:HSP20 family protein
MAESSALTQKDRAEQTSPESTRGGLYFAPRVDIYETENELTLYADVPGCRSEDVDLRFEQGELILHARVGRRHPEQQFLLQEYEEGDFYRVFAVHESIDSSRIQAECKDGVLTVHLPKVEAAKPKQISVRG